MNARQLRGRSDPPLRVLILGGTREAYELACVLAEGGAPYEPITSLAGRTAEPRIPAGALRSGGFGGVAGIAAYLVGERIDAVVDATHPFAARISANAVAACRQTQVPLVTFARPVWTPGADDRWERVADVSSAATLAYSRGLRLFLTIGRRELEPFAAMADRYRLVRSVDPPELNFAGDYAIVLGRGPFSVADELALMRAYGIDVVVTRESGGGELASKILAARTLSIDVIVVERPAPSGAPTVSSVAEATTWIASLAERATIPDETPVGVTGGVR